MDYLTVSANNSTKYGTGISLTYAPDYYINEAMPAMVGMAQLMGESVLPHKLTLRKHVNSWVLGASFAVSF